MRIVIAGGHGKIALLLSSALATAGHEPVGLIRNASQAGDVRATGATPLVLDLEQSDVTQVAQALAGADAVVFAAGAGPDSGRERKLTVDRDGAILLGRAAVEADVRRMIVVSSVGADSGDADSDDVMQVYLYAKGAADAGIRELDLDATIVRPGTLTDDDATGRIRTADHVDGGSIPRADVAAIIARLIEDGSSVGRTFEVISGDTPIAEALKAL